MIEVVMFCTGDFHVEGLQCKKKSSAVAELF